MLRRAYARIEIKAIDDEERIIEGIASTPSTDRMEDIVEPLGAQFSLPIPFLWQHESREAAVGEVFFAKPTKEGIPFRAKLASDDVPGILKDRLDYAWRSIKKGLVRGVSIGFRSLELEQIPGTFGLRFIRWEWLELSAVTIPANAEATIQAIKSFDLRRRAASGPPVHCRSPGASGTPPTLPKTAGARTMSTKTMNLSDEIKSLEATRQSKQARMLDIQKAASDAGATKDEAQQEEFDTLAEELKTIDREIKDLRTLEAMNVERAAPVGGKTHEEAVNSRGGKSTPVAREKTLPPGVALARVVRCMGWAARKNRDVEAVAREMYPDDSRTLKAAVAAGTTSGTTWAGPLVGDETGVFADFVEWLRPQTILGRFGTDGIPGLRNVPFRVPLINQTSGGNAAWVGEGAGAGLTKFDFSRATLEPLYLGTIAVVTEQLLGSSSPSAETILRDQLAAALRERMDISFIDPAVAAVAGVSPGAITNGVTPVTSSGTDADAVRADVKALMALFIAANNPPTTGVWVMSATMALSLSLMRNALGQPEFPSLTMAGGTFIGLPVIVSEHVPFDPTPTTGGHRVVLANASDIYLGDEGGVSVDVSREASLQMDSAPTQSSGTPTATSVVSLWQTGSVGFRATREVNWLRRRAEAVQMLAGVNWA